MRSLVLTALLLAACHKALPPRAPETDPAVADALADPIMADPGLGLSQGQASQIGIPVGAAPEFVDGLPTLGNLIEANRTGPFAACRSTITYSYGWSAKLAADLALPDDAKVIEAAGHDASGCALRIVRYGVARAPADSLGVWRIRKGFSTKESAGGVEGVSGNAAFRAIAYPAPGGANVDLIIRLR